MSGYYPPGVTGGEYQIAGPDVEYSCSKSCDAVMIADDGAQSECDYSGYVDCWVYDDVEHWECPKCRYEHSSELGPDVDVDALYDAWRERSIWG